MFLILHTDCVITCMFFYSLKARGIFLVYALTHTIGKTEPFLKVLMERCWLDLRNTASISSSSWGKQFCAVCLLGEAWENNMKMISFSLQQAYLALAGKRWNKGEVEAFLIYSLCLADFFLLVYLPFSSRFSSMTENKKRWSGWCLGWGLDGDREVLQRTLIDMSCRRKVTHQDALTVRKLSWTSGTCMLVVLQGGLDRQKRWNS